MAEAEQPQAAAAEQHQTRDRKHLPVAVIKATPYVFDLGLLAAFDTNPLALPAASSQSSDSSSIESLLASTARDGAQALINQLLTTCALSSTTTGVNLALPAPHTPLPREKPVPEAKVATKWERFAAKKGIRAKTREQQRNLVYNEESGEWEPKWGRKGAANKKAEEQWLVEVDPKKDKERAEKVIKRGGNVIINDSGEVDPRSLARAERKERVRRNDRRMRKNLYRSEDAKKSGRG